MSGYVDPASNREPLTEINDDLPCAGCGYNLRGLTTDLRCPECNMPVARTASGNYLCYSDPAWVAKLAFCTSLYRWGILASLALGLLGGVGVAALGIGGLLPPVGTVVLIGAIGLLGHRIFLWAAFLLTTQEPRISLHEDTLTARRIVRTCAVITFTGQVVQAAAPALSAPDLMSWVSVLGAVLSLASIAGFFAQFVYVRKFALRLPDARLAESTKTVMWGFIVSYGVLLVGGLTAVLSKAGSSGSSAGTQSAGATVGMMGGGVVACAAIVAVLVFVCWAYRLLLKYNRSFKLAAEEARAIGTSFS